MSYIWYEIGEGRKCVSSMIDGVVILLKELYPDLYSIAIDKDTSVHMN